MRVIKAKGEGCRFLLFVKSTGGFGGWSALASEPAYQQSFYPFSVKSRLVVAGDKDLHSQVAPRLPEG